MILGKKVAIFDWEWGRNSAPKDGQKSPSMVKVFWITFFKYAADIIFRRTKCFCVFRLRGMDQDSVVTV